MNPETPVEISAICPWKSWPRFSGQLSHLLLHLINLCMDMHKAIVWFLQTLPHTKRVLLQLQVYVGVFPHLFKGVKPISSCITSHWLTGTPQLFVFQSCIKGHYRSLPVQTPAMDAL